MPAHADLVSYIQDQTRQCTTAHAIHATLLSAGWSDADILNAFHDVAAGMLPMTTGVSIHEDLAQVRGMVAHLASRIGSLEESIRSSAMLPLPQLELPKRTSTTSLHWMTVASWVLATLIALGTMVAIWQKWLIFQ